MASAESKLEELVSVLEEAQALLDRHAEAEQFGSRLVPNRYMVTSRRIETTLADINQQLRTWAGIDGPA